MKEILAKNIDQVRAYQQKSDQPTRARKQNQTDDDSQIVPSDGASDRLRAPDKDNQTQKQEAALLPVAV
jgi:hypothetical protein